MSVMNFDLEDGLPPVSFALKPADVERFVAFMAECNQATKRAAELEAQLAAALQREATDYNEAVDEIARLADRRPAERNALALSIAELDQLANSNEGELTPSQAESILLVLHELSRLQQAQPAPAQDNQQVVSGDHNPAAVPVAAQEPARRGGDIGAGHFRRSVGGAWHEVPRGFAGNEGVVILYHAEGWPAPAQGEPLNEFQRCSHPDCGRFKDGAGWSCRALRDNACAREYPPETWKVLPSQQRVRLEAIRAAIANDSYAISFQSMRQYRSALLAILSTGKPSQEPVGEKS